MKKILAIVINKLSFLENDEIVTVFSLEYGKLAFIAKGIKKPQSKNKSSVQLFSFAEFEIFKSIDNSRVHKLKTGHLKNNYFNIVNHYDNYLYAISACLLLDKIMQPSLKNKVLFNSTLQLFTCLATNNHPFLAWTWWIFNFIAVCSIKWNFTKCLICHQAKRYFTNFDFTEKQVICFKCDIEYSESRNDLTQELIKLQSSKSIDHFLQTTTTIKITILNQIAILIVNFFENEIGVWNIGLEKVRAKIIKHV